MDLTMMAFNPAHSRLRTEEEIYFLLEQSGFVDAQTYPTRASYAIIESFPSPRWFFLHNNNTFSILIVTASQWTIMEHFLCDNIIVIIIVLIL